MKLSFSLTTPQKVKDIRDAVIYLVSSCLVLNDFLGPKFGMSASDYATWSGILIIVAKFGAKLFGVSESEAVENAVKAIDEVKKVQ